jgi:hypothetical protein
VSEKNDYSVLREYIQKEVFNQFTNLILPAFEGKIRQRIADCEVSLVQNIDKIGEVKFRVQGRMRRNHNKLKT